MRKRHLLVGLAMLVASAASYGLVQMTAASAATAGSVEAQSASAGVTAAASPVLTPSVVVAFEAVLESTPDPVMLLLAGVMLFGAAEGVRRRAL